MDCYLAYIIIILVIKYIDFHPIFELKTNTFEKSRVRYYDKIKTNDVALCEIITHNKQFTWHQHDYSSIIQYHRYSIWRKVSTFLLHELSLSPESKIYPKDHLRA